MSVQRVIQGDSLKVLRIDFLRTSVEINDQANSESAEGFDFAGSRMRFAVEAGTNDDDTLWVAVGFATIDHDQQQPTCPYLIDMQAIGTFAWDQPLEPEDRQNVLYEQGVGDVYAAIREMVATITARSAKGILIIPTPSFPELMEAADAGAEP